MFQFGSEDLNVFLQNEDKSFDNSGWEFNELRLEPLSNTPFDFFNTSQHEDTQTTISENTESTKSTERWTEQDIWTKPITIPTQLNTLSWDTHLEKTQTGTPFITEVHPSLFEPILQSDEGHVIIEEDLVHHLIQALHGVPSIYFYWDGDTLKRYGPLRVLGVSSVCIDPVIDRVLLFGSQLQSLARLGQHYQTHPTRYGQTGVAFGSCLREFHLNMQYNLENLRTIESMTILKLQQSLDHLFFVVDRLHQFCQVELPLGAGILNALYQEIKPLDLILDGSFGLYRDICLSFLSYTSVPYIHMLNQWLQMDDSHFDLEDPYSEFFIEILQAKDIQKKYQIQPDCTLPYFIHKEMSFYILRSGISLRLLKHDKPEHLIFHPEYPISLKFVFNSTESEKLLEDLKNSIRQIQAYNNNPDLVKENQVTIEENMDDSLDELEEDQMMTEGIEEDHKEFTLAALNQDILRDDEFSVRLKELIMNQRKETIPSIDTITIQSYIKPLEIWCPVLNESFMKSLFLNGPQFEYHLSIIYQFYLLGNGIFANGLENTWVGQENFYSLNVALESLLIESSRKKEDELISLRLTKNMRLMDVDMHSAILEIIFNVQHPMDIILPKEVLEKYDIIFQFLTHVNRANAMVKKVFEIIREKQWKNKHTERRVNGYRFELNQFTNGLTHYIHCSVIESAWIKFKQHIYDEPDFIKFMTYQDFTIDCILYQCFLKKNQTKVYEVLLSIFKDITLFYTLILSIHRREEENEEKIELKCKRIIDQFKTHTTIFVKILVQVENKGSGRLSNILKHSYHKHNELDVFVKDLIMHLNLNHFYD